MLTKENILQALSWFWEKIKTLLNNKVDKIEGRSLSEANFTNDEKVKLGAIAANANNYNLPVASSSVLGGIKVGANLSITPDGKLNADAPAVSEATTGTAGLMSAADKTKLNAIHSSLLSKTSDQIAPIKQISINNVAQSVSIGNVNISVPKKVTDLSDASNYMLQSYATTVNQNINAAKQEALDANAATEAKVNQLTQTVQNQNAERILNKGDVNMLLADDLQTKLTQYVQTNYSRTPLHLDAIIVKYTDAANDYVKYTYNGFSSTWIDVGKAGASVTIANNAEAGIAKLYDSTIGDNTDGSMTQRAIKVALNSKQNQMQALTREEILAIFEG